MFQNVIDQNDRFLSYKYDMNVKNVIKFWDNRCQEQTEIIIVSELIKELCNMRDTYQEYLLSRDEIKSIITTLCTD